MSLEDLTTACDLALANLRIERGNRSKVATYTLARIKLIAALRTLLRHARLAERAARTQSPTPPDAELAKLEEKIEAVKNITCSLIEDTNENQKEELQTVQENLHEMIMNIEEKLMDQIWVDLIERQVIKIVYNTK